MIDLLMVLSSLLSFVAAAMILPWLIRYLRRIDMVVQDQHKEGKPLIPLSGGVGVLGGVVAGFMVFIFFQTFLPRISKNAFLNERTLILLLAAIITIFAITFVGFIDDLLIRKSKVESAGLRQWQKPLLTLGAAVPLMVAKAGQSSLIVPLFGRVDFGVLYPLVLIPMGVVGAANMVNLFAGLNGLEAGLGIIYLSSLGAYAYVHGRYLAALIAFITCGALIAFWLYNKVPAKILPGDSLTYLLGATLATIAIVGDLEKATLIISIPFMIEFFLKLRGKFKKTTVGYEKAGRIYSHYDRIYSLPHIFMRRGRYTEKQAVYLLLGIELIFAALIWIV
jgi:UDP-N-acetylglucosamine--dolichyl-phosphate N-acetylglucosaminephosphotransferase